MTDRTYVIQDPNHLNRDFYENFDEAYLFKKASTLLTIVENLEQFKGFLEDTGENADFINAKFAESLRAEIHFSELHQFEAFFAIMLAIFQDLPHWLYLKEYRSGDIRLRAEFFLDEKIEKLTNNRVDSEHDFLNWAIYAGFESNKAEHRKEWQTNLNGIIWIMKRMASKYINGLEEYNSYKHGMRFLTGHTYLNLFPTSQPSEGIRYDSDDSLRFLETKKIKDEEVFVVRKVFKHFSPVESINHLFFMSAVLEVVKAVRLARIKGEEHSALIRFFTIDRDALNEEKLSSIRWAVPV